MDKTLYRCLIKERNDKEPFFQNYWARASHLGEGIQIMLDAAKENGLIDPYPAECDPSDVAYLPDDMKPFSDRSVFWSPDCFYFPPEERLSLPTGIIACIYGENERDTEEIVRGYTVEPGENDLTFIDVNVDCSELLSTYEKLLSIQPSYKVFWYILHEHWNDDPADLFLVNEGLDTADKIMKHLNDNLPNSIQNGYVSLTAYLNEGATNLSITDHKQISISSRSPDLAERYASALEGIGIPKTEYLATIKYGFHHWHYRVPGSFDRGELEKHLKSLRFSEWNPQEDQ